GGRRSGQPAAQCPLRLQRRDPAAGCRTVRAAGRALDAARGAAGIRLTRQGRHEEARSIPARLTRNGARTNGRQTREETMKTTKRSRLRGGVLAIALALGLSGIAAAKTFRIADQGDALSMDPHSLNESLQLSFTGNIYEPLVARDKKLGLVPG